MMGILVIPVKMAEFSLCFPNPEQNGYWSVFA
jgi:hypothetical protein